MTPRSGSGSTWGIDEGWCSNLMWSEIICQLQPEEHLTFSAAPEGSRPWLSEGETLFWFTRNYLFLPLPNSQGHGLVRGLSHLEEVCVLCHLSSFTFFVNRNRMSPRVNCSLSAVWCQRSTLKVYTELTGALGYCWSDSHMCAEDREWCGNLQTLPFL